MHNGPLCYVEVLLGISAAQELILDYFQPLSQRPTQMGTLSLASIAIFASGQGTQQRFDVLFRYLPDLEDWARGNSNSEEPQRGKESMVFIFLQFPWEE
jgi:hypothetical protein